MSKKMKDLEAAGWAFTSGGKENVALAKDRQRHLAVMEQIAKNLAGPNGHEATAQAIGDLTKSHQALADCIDKGIKSVVAELGRPKNISLECDFHRGKNGRTKKVIIKSI